MGSEQQAKDLLALIDKSAQEIDVLDTRLKHYDSCLKVSYLEVTHSSPFLTILITFFCLYTTLLSRGVFRTLSDI